MTKQESYTQREILYWKNQFFKKRGMNGFKKCNIFIAVDTENDIKPKMCGYSKHEKW